MGDLLQQLPSDYIPPSESEKKAFSLLYGMDLDQHVSQSSLPTMMKSEKLDSKTTDISSLSTTPIERSSTLPTLSVLGCRSVESTTLGCLLLLFILCTWEPILQIIRRSFPFFETCPYFFWGLRCIVFTIGCFLILNRELLKSSSVAK